MRQSFALFLSLATMAYGVRISASHTDYNPNSFAQFGEKTHFTCEDGSIRFCNSGTEGCYKEAICELDGGYTIEITCPDSTHRYCQAGTQHCADDDEETCANKPDTNGLAQSKILGHGK